MKMNKTIESITERIIARSAETRSAYLKQMQQARINGVARSAMSCGNLAHAYAGCSAHEKDVLAENELKNIGIITSYNDMLSAHKVYEDYPKQLRAYATKHLAVAQVAGAVPAMCDGVTQGQDGMDLSLFSRDVVAMSTIVGLSHNVFDAVLCLGICDKIVPGLLMGSLRFGHLPVVFVPGGPMPSGISNEEKSNIRQLFAEGKIGRAELLKGESDSYHSPGTCTFYGTANSNQMLMEIMGLQLPGSSFVNPGTALRDLLNEEAVRIAAENARKGSNLLMDIVSEKTIVNGIIGLLATGGSTNHTIHLIAMARAAGIIINWEDMSDLSAVIPLITRMYPNGAADVNHFHAAGGMGFVMHTLLEHGLLHDDVTTILGKGLSKYTQEPYIVSNGLAWREGAKESLNDTIIRGASNPFSVDGGIKIIKGNIGRSVVKTAAVSNEHLIIEAPAIVFIEQHELIAAFKNNELNRDFIAVLPFQGPAYKGMPELHQLTPTLTILQKKGYRVALVTDGRMSGASGKVPAAIHMSPEASKGGNIGKIKTGDLLTLNCVDGTLTCQESDFEQRNPLTKEPTDQVGLGRELFGVFRREVTDSEEGACTLF
ncbi:MAG: phosphogluconate dehydratase [Flavobacteriales bacterium]